MGLRESSLRVCEIKKIQVEMNKIDLRKWLLSNAFSKNGDKFNSYWHKKFLDIYLSLEKYTSFFSNASVSQRTAAFLNGQTELNRCIVCNKELYPKQGNPEIYCGRKCSARSPLTRKKTRITNKRVYGGSAPLSSKEIRDKTKQTCLQRYGCENPMQNESIRYKSEETCLQRYSVKYVLASEEMIHKRKGSGNPIHRTGVKKKIKETCLQRYGVENPAKSNEVKLKSIETNLKRYGVKYSGQSHDVKKKIKETFKQRFENGHPFKDPKIISKIKETCIERYGVESHFQKHISGKSLKLLNSEKWMKYNYEELGKSPIEIGNLLGVGRSTVIRYLHKHNIRIRMPQISKVEKEIFKFIQVNCGVKIHLSDRKILGNQELDIYLPDHDLAIEYNGVYWHCEGRGRGRNFHLSKTLRCEEQGIQLLHIFSSDDLDVWKSIIHSKLGKVKKIGARQTSVEKLTSKQAKEFCDGNHLQGSVNASLRLGLVYEGTLVSVMTFGKSRFNKNYQWELLRFCSKKGFQVMGAASKLLKHSGIRNCISYANRRWSNGKLYESIGFDKVGESQPNYFYTKDGNTLLSRNQFQKHKLAARLENFDPGLTEYQNMLNHGYDRIWDCGNLVYEYVK